MWIAAVCILGPLGTRLPGETNDEFVLPGGTQTSQVREVLAARFPDGGQRTLLLVYHRAGGLSAADRRRVAADAVRAARIPLAARPVPAFAAGSPPELVSRDRKTAVTIVPLSAGEVIHTTPSVEALRKLTDDAPPGLEMHVTGWTAVQSDYNSAIKEADVKLLVATGGLVLLLLLAVYRAPLLALLPLLVVGLAYVVATGILDLLARTINLPVDSTSTSLVLVLMFGAGTDYCLLLVARYRAALRTEPDPAAAVARALPEAAPAMVASGLTVIAALLVMLSAIFGVNRTLGPVNAVGVAVVLLASITLLPALLAAFGRRAFWPRHHAEPSTSSTQERLWEKLGERVRRRPAVWLAAAATGLVAASFGLLTYKPTVDAIAQFRHGTDGTRGYETLRADFPAGALAPVTAIVAAPQVQAVSRRIAADRGVAAVTDTGRRSRDGKLAALTVTFVDEPFQQPALDRVARLRNTVPGGVLLGEGSGERLDFKRAASRDLWVVIPLVLLVVFGTLVVLLRSLVAPLYLLATVILSFLGTLGLALAIFRVAFDQHSFDPALPLIVFIFLVALGADYNIFLMSRVREEAVRFGTAEGMRHALVATGPVITSAGLILAGTFSVLMVLPIWDLFEIGFVVALGVLIDTFVVRSIAVPALTWLCGDRAWWPSRI